jgi:hypothetical protein
VREFEPLTPTLPVVRKGLSPAETETPQHKPEPFNTVECSWTTFNAHQFSRFPPPRTGCETDQERPILNGQIDDLSSNILSHQWNLSARTTLHTASAVHSPGRQSRHGRRVPWTLTASVVALVAVQVVLSARQEHRTQRKHMVSCTRRSAVPVVSGSHEWTMTASNSVSPIQSFGHGGCTGSSPGSCRCTTCSGSSAPEQVVHVPARSIDSPRVWSAATASTLYLPP